MMYDHFQTILKPELGISSNFPWCCFLALKWKLSEPLKRNVSPMNKRDFIDIVNRIYNLQNEVSGFFDDKKVLLSLRRMIINQQLYQAPMKLELNTLARQYYWYCNYDGGYFDKVFQETHGITLESYYKISAYFAMMSCIDNGKVVAIKKKLSGYDDASFITMMYDHFQTILKPELGISSNFPWCCFLALKWKLSEPLKRNVSPMNKRDFIDIVNRIYNLQNEVSGFFDDKKVLLSLRRMIINQQLYQAPMKLELNTL
ncbi:hypothetical protein ACE1SU_30905, partial [Klebsiella pneumoniae]